MPSGYVSDSVGSDIGVLQTSYAGTPVDLSSPWVWAMSDKIRFQIDERSKLTNLSYNAQTWGSFIPITWGTVRVEGAMIWASSFREQLLVTSWKRLSTNGRPKFQTNLGYNYTVDAGYSFGYNGRPGSTRFLSRLYMNNTIVYDYAGGYRYPGLAFVFYDGKPDQMPAKIYVDDKGPDAVAFRNQMTVFIQNIPIGDFGAAIPSVWAEIVTEDELDAAANFFEMTSTNATLSAPKGFLMIDWVRRRVYQPITDYLQTGEENPGIAIYDVDTKVQIGEVPVNPDPGINWSSAENWIYIPWMQVILSQFSLNGPMQVIEADTGRVLSTFSEVAGEDLEASWQLAIAPDYVNDGGAWFATTALFNNKIWIGRINDDFQIAVGFQLYVYDEGLPRFGVIFGDDVLSRFYYAYTVGGDEDKNFVGLIDCEELSNTNRWLELPTPYDNSNDWAIAQIIQWNGIVCVFVRHSANNQMAVIAFDGESQEVVWTVADDTAFSPNNNHIREGNYEAGTIAWRTGNSVKIIDIMSGTLTTITSEDFAGKNGVWDGDSRSFYGVSGGVPYQFYAQAPASGFMRLDAWMADVLNMAGFDESEYAIINVDDVIEGAFINQAYDPLKMLDDVSALYRITRTERDGILIYEKKEPNEGEAVSEIDFTYDKLAWINQSDDTRFAIQMALSSEISTPSEISVQFINPETNYQDDVYNWRRPGVTTTSAQSMSLRVPLIIAKETVSELAQNMLYDAWGGQITGNLRLPRMFYYVDQGTIATLSNGPYTDVIRLVETTHNGDWSVSASFEVLRSQRGARGRVDPFVPNTPAPRGRPESELYFFNVPLLSADDNEDGKIVYYMTMAGIGQPNWPGGWIAHSPDGEATFGALASVRGDTPIGRAVNTIGDGTSDLRVSFRGVNPFTIEYTDDELAADETLNRAFYGVNGRWEIIRWKTATLDSKGMVVFDGIERSVRGSNNSGHQTGDLLIPIGDNIHKVVFPLAYFDTLRFFKAVGYGLPVNRVPTYEFVIEGGSLKPWSPNVRRIADRDGDDLMFTWWRRDRLGFNTLGTDEPLPLSDAPEEYELEVLDGSGDIVRTVTALGSPAWVYEAADREADLGPDMPVSITVRVFQISASVGRGFPSETVVFVS